MTTSADKSSTSLFYVDKDGRKRDDGLHDDAPANSRAHAAAAVQRAIDRGRTPEDAQREYGDTAPLGELFKK